MKLYFYILERPFREEPYIKSEECEVEEKPKTYRPIGRFPSSYYRYYVKKEDVGHILDSYGMKLILCENNPKLAMDLFRKYINTKIRNYECRIDTERENLKAVEEFERRLS